MVYPRDVERGGSNPFVRASTTRVQTLSLDLEIVTRERVDQECHGEEARDNCPGKGYLNSGPRTSRIYQDSFPCSRNPDDKLPGNRQIVIRWNVLKKLQRLFWTIPRYLERDEFICCNPGRIRFDDEDAIEDLEITKLLVAKKRPKNHHPKVKDPNLWIRFPPSVRGFGDRIICRISIITGNFYCRGVEKRRAVVANAPNEIMNSTVSGIRWLYASRNYRFAVSSVSYFAPSYSDETRGGEGYEKDKRERRRRRRRRTERRTRDS